VDLPAPMGLAQRDMPTAQAAVVDMFRLIGEAMPGADAQGARVRQQLIFARYRWPSAVSVFLVVKCATAVMLSVAAIGVTMAFRSDPLAALLPAACGLGLGYMLPDRVVERLTRRRIGRLRRGLPAALNRRRLVLDAQGRKNLLSTAPKCADWRLLP
jgi:hypothetical protein